MFKIKFYLAIINLHVLSYSMVPVTQSIRKSGIKFRLMNIAICLEPIHRIYTDGVKADEEVFIDFKCRDEKFH